MSTKTQKIVILICIVLLTLSTLIVSIGVFKMYQVVKVFDLHFAEGTLIESIPIGGMTFEEAEGVVQEYILQQTTNQFLTLRADAFSHTIPFVQLGVDYELDETLAQAFHATHKGNLIERYQLAKNGLVAPMVFELIPNHTLAGITQAVQANAYLFHREPVDATISRQNRQFILTPEKSGQTVAIAPTAQCIYEILQQQPEQSLEVDVILESLPAKQTQEALKAVQSPIASFYTSYNDSDLDRNKNLVVAANKINKVLLPGEVFSLGEQLEPITFESGYRPSKVIVNGKLEEGIGGGVCQIASTLYNAVLLSDLEMMTRANHSLPVAYVPLGRDATYASGNIDFKFKNTSEYPVFIESYCANNRVYVNLFSHTSLKPPYDSVKFESQVIETFEPPAPTIIQDSALYVDQRIQEVTPLEGKTIKLYKLCYTNGELVHRELVNTSYYRSRAEVVRQGTQERPLEAAAIASFLGTQKPH